MTSAATIKIAKDLKSMLDDPVEGIFCELVDESNVFQWNIYIEGPRDTAYEGGIFLARMEFPKDYPMSPPKLAFLSEFWHPNVYRDGKVCISILHSPGSDEMSGERPEERWLPTQTVSTILLSVLSMLNSPNISSPANVDASVMYRDHFDEYTAKCQKLAKLTVGKVPSHVKIPHPDTDPVERERRVQKMKLLNEEFTLEDGLMDYDFDEEDDYEYDSDDGVAFFSEDEDEDDEMANTTAESGDEEDDE